MSFKGKVKSKEGVNQISDSFKKQDIVITDNSNDQYPQDIVFQTSQDRCSLLDNINIGDEVELEYNLRGSKPWVNGKGETKYFNTLDIWKIQKVGGVPNM